MANLQEKFNRQEFLREFTGAFTCLEAAQELGERYGSSGFSQLFLVGCGAPYAMMKSAGYWGDRFAANKVVRVYHAAEFFHLNPASLNKNTVVILGSHSGTTREVLEAAEYISGKPCPSIAVTQSSDSPLGKKTALSLSYGESKQGYFCSAMVTFAFISSFLENDEKAWDFHPLLIDSLQNFPAALAEAKEIFIDEGKRLAEKLCFADPLFIIGSGPMFTTAYIYAACFLMEMQWMHAFSLSAAEFFHGPFEVFDSYTSGLLLLGEDPSRSEAERVLSFLEKYAHTPFVIDSREFPMNGIHKKIRPLLAPFIVDAALTNMVETMGEIKDHPLTKRRYMGKVDY